MTKKRIYRAKQQRSGKKFVVKQSSSSSTTRLPATQTGTWSEIFSNELTSAGKQFKAVSAIESGLKVATVDEIAGELNLPALAIREIARISPSTFSRRQKSGVLSPEESDRVYRLRSVIEKATEFFEGNKNAARKWLNTPAPALGGVRPISMLVNDAGVREVESLLGRLEYGVFT
jgi:putative toxin-antitoxin system antitoxin component (TIGR02293 family)